MREAHTAVLVRGETWAGEVATEPYEAGWADEAVFFIRALDAAGDPIDAEGEVMISPDGIHWAAEGTKIRMPGARDEVTFCRVANFGHFLRLRAALPPGASRTVVVTLALKG